VRGELQSGILPPVILLLRSTTRDIIPIIVPDLDKRSVHIAVPNIIFMPNQLLRTFFFVFVCVPHH